MSLTIDRIECFVLGAPVETPVQTSFGIMHERPALFVRVTERDGATGWGEIWCNFPAVGARHRARLVDTVFSALLLNQRFDTPLQAFDVLTSKTAVLAIQSGEPGPIAQCIAGLDIALWDLHARRLQQPLWRLLGGSDPTIKVYASGLNPTQPEVLAARVQAQGYRAFKLKVGFGLQRDLENLQALRAALGPAELMVDANQAWDLATAQMMSATLAQFKLAWMEEPLRADRPWSEWQQLALSSPIALAAGENIAGAAAFDAAMASGALGVIQPDMAKWGGFSATLPVARKILSSGARFCPHYLGGGIGLLASAHLLAAAGGSGMLEVDANPNPLRTMTCGAAGEVSDGTVTLSDAPGLGSTVDTTGFEAFLST